MRKLKFFTMLIREARKQGWETAQQVRVPAVLHRIGNGFLKWQLSTCNFKLRDPMPSSDLHDHPHSCGVHTNKTEREKEGRGETRALLGCAVKCPLQKAGPQSAWTTERDMSRDEDSGEKRCVLDRQKCQKRPCSFKASNQTTIKKRHPNFTESSRMFE